MEPAPAADERPLVSVVITSYNYARYIAESIASVLTQDFPSFELIVVDNASTDQTSEVVAGFRADPRLRYVENATNIGLTPNHNRGLALARGEYIVFVSADDRLLPGHLRASYDYLQAHPQTDLVYAGAIFIDADGNPIGVRSLGGQLPVDYDGGRNEFAAQLATGCYVAWPSSLARRSLYDELGPLDERLTAADYDITLRWAAAGKRFGYLRTPLAAIRVHAPQASGRAYRAGGGELADFLATLETFVVPANAGRMQGWTGAIAHNVRARADAYRRSSGQELPPDVAARVEALLRRIDELPALRPAEALGAAPLISVIVRIETIAQLIVSLNSLAAQREAPPWEAIVVAEGGADFGPLLRSLAYADRVRFVRLDHSTGAGAARNLGLQLAGGRIVTYLEPGNAFRAGHLASLAAAFEGGAPVVRSNGRALLGETRDGTPNTLIGETPVAGLFRGTEDDERDLVAASVPIDTVAHLLGTVERTGPFRPDWPAGDAWEYWLRLRRVGVVAYNPDGEVDVRIIRQRILPGANYLTVAHSIYAAYAVAPETPLAQRRAVYVQNVTRLMEGGPEAIAGDIKAIEALATIAGFENAVAGRQS
jgi:glycosyltransferase involved in cell wall biosynthesis